MAFLELKGVEKYFGPVHAIKGIQLRIEKGEFIVFVGPSGCGKSTLLRMIAGLTEIDAGTLHLDGREITTLPSSKRDLAMVFQSYALYPHMSVFDNMSFALRLAKVDKAVIKEKVERAAEILNLTQYLQRTPKELSGGQRQRVAIGRAIVRAPKVFLFDEPLSNLDAALRGQTRVEIAKLHRELGATTIYVTHDQVEAMTMADRVVVLRDGAIEQVGTPLELYDHPSNKFVAQFIGTPQMNMIDTARLTDFAEIVGAPDMRDGYIGVRPEHVLVKPQGTGALTAEVEIVESLGADTLIYANTQVGSASAEAVQLISRQNTRTELRPGAKIGIDITPASYHLFDRQGRALPSKNLNSQSSEPMTNVILHLGLGSFHRAHQAVYLNRLREQGDRSWSIVGGNIRSDMADTLVALATQRGEYTLETISPAGHTQYERIQSIQHIVPYDENLTGLVEIGAQNNTHIISFTVTEAGYYLDSAHRLDTSHPDLKSDLTGRTRLTIYGAMAAILHERIKRGAGPVTLMNCDNLRSNGDRFRAGFIEFLEQRHDHSTKAWVEQHTSCPNAMVDRITPRPRPEVAQRVKAATGWDDKAPVMGESFIQWVIEDHFASSRPAWETVGAELVSSVLPYEEAKIRILNAQHSCIAWAGTLKGLNYIHEGLKVPEIRRMAYDYVTEDVIPCLSPSPIDLAKYRDVVLDRFSNPHLRDTNQRVAMDGFSKIPGFIVPTLQERLSKNESIEKTAVLPALFFAFLGRWHRGELNYVYQDGVMDASIAHGFFDSVDPLAAFCGDSMLWGPLAGSKPLIDAVRLAYGQVQAFIAGELHV